MSNIADWLSQYPLISDPNLSGKLASNAEFSLLAGKSVEAPPAVGEKYAFQTLFERLYSIYDNALVIAAPGVGKTCMAAALTEALKRIYRANAEAVPSLLKPVTYRRIYVLVRGDLIMNNFRNELACRCTKGVYELPEHVYMTASNRQSNISRQIAKYYELNTYTKFAKSIKAYSDEQLAAEYNGCVFIIDEAHNIIPKRTGIRTRRYARRQRVGTVDEAEVKQSQQTYDTLHRLFHAIKRLKVILLTATPVKANPVQEFATLVNLLRPADSQMPGSDGTRENMSLDEFGQWLHGYIMYVRELDTGVDFAFQGQRLGALIRQPDLTTVVVPLQMSAHQSRVYAAAYEQYGNEDFYGQIRQAINMVYPDGSFGTPGFQRYVIEDSRGMWRFTPEMLAALTEARTEYPGNPLVKFSAKFAHLAAMTYKYYAEGKKGYIFEEFKEGSGVIPGGLLFEYAGIERYTRTESAFGSPGSGTGGGFCTAGSGVSDTREVLIPKKIRYGLLLPEIPAGMARSTIELYNSPQNIHGEYMVQLIFSPFGKEGISFDSIQWQAENPSWIWSSMKQTLYRGRRTTSQIKLLEEARRTDPNARLKLDVLQLACYPGPPASGIFSIDLYMYTEAEELARANAPFLERAKAEANDCYLEYNRNVRPNDQALAGTADCDYGNCVYTCDSVAPSGAQDYSGLIRRYADDSKPRITAILKRLMLNRTAVPLTEVLTTLIAEAKASREVVLVELGRILDDRNVFTNRFGQQVYLHLSAGYLIGSPEYPGGNSGGLTAVQLAGRQFSQLKCLTELPAIRIQSLDAYLKTQAETQLATRTDWFVGTPQEVLARLDTMSLEEKARLLEQAVGEATTPGATPSPGAQAVIGRYQPKLYAVVEPVAEIRQLISERQGSRARLEHPLPPLPPDVINPPMVYLHTVLMLLASQTTRYNLSTRSLKPTNIRIYFPGSGTWRDANWIEELVYQRYIENAITQREQPMWSTGLYGYYILDDPEDELRIIDTFGSEGVRDQRTVHRGHVCDTWEWDILGVIVYQLGLTNIVQPDMSLTPEEITTILTRKRTKLRTSTMDEARFVATFIKESRRIGSAETICRIIRERLQQLGRLAVR